MKLILIAVEGTLGLHHGSSSERLALLLPGPLRDCGRKVQRPSTASQRAARLTLCLSGALFEDIW